MFIFSFIFPVTSNKIDWIPSSSNLVWTFSLWNSYRRQRFLFVSVGHIELSPSDADLSQLEQGTRTIRPIDLFQRAKEKRFAIYALFNIDTMTSCRWTFSSSTSNLSGLYRIIFQQSRAFARKRNHLDLIHQSIGERNFLAIRLVDVHFVFSKTTGELRSFNMARFNSSKDLARPGRDFLSSTNLHSAERWNNSNLVERFPFFIFSLRFVSLFGMKVIRPVVSLYWKFDLRWTRFFSSTTNSRSTNASPDWSTAKVKFSSRMTENIPKCSSITPTEQFFFAINSMDSFAKNSSWMTNFAVQVQFFFAVQEIDRLFTEIISFSLTGKHNEIEVNSVMKLCFPSSSGVRIRFYAESEQDFLDTQLDEIRSTNDSNSKSVASNRNVSSKSNSTERVILSDRKPSSTNEIFLSESQPFEPVPMFSYLQQIRQQVKDLCQLWLTHCRSMLGLFLNRSSMFVSSKFIIRS